MNDNLNSQTNGEVNTVVNSNLNIPDSMSVKTDNVLTTPAVEKPKTRYNPVTGEEMSMDELFGKKKEEAPAEASTEPQQVESTVPSTIPTDSGIIYSDEKIKRIQVEYKPPSKFKLALLIVFFAGLIAFIIFLPEIQAFIAEYNSKDVAVQEITTGKLVCTLSTSTVNLDMDVNRTFSYEENKLKSAKFETITRGDPTLDEDALNELNDSCESLHTYVDELSGVNVSCLYEQGKLTKKESFDYSTYDKEKVNAAYIEAGGDILEFDLDEDINQIMKRMRQGGFACEKQK